jgi:hypothetical protein
LPRVGGALSARSPAVSRDCRLDVKRGEFAESPWEVIAHRPDWQRPPVRVDNRPAFTLGTFIGVRPFPPSRRRQRRRFGGHPASLAPVRSLMKKRLRPHAQRARGIYRGPTRAELEEDEPRRNRTRQGGTSSASGSLLISRQRFSNCCGMWPVQQADGASRARDVARKCHRRDFGPTNRRLLSVSAAWMRWRRESKSR